MEWEPEAYPGVSLRQHLCCVAEAVLHLFRDRLSVKGGPLGVFNGVLGGSAALEAAVLAGALHDIGKASRYYRGKRSYWLHEAVSAFLAYHAAVFLARTGQSRGAAILAVAAAAAARHHAAMAGRLPWELQRRRMAGSVARIASGLTVPLVARAARGIVPGCVLAQLEDVAGIAEASRLHRFRELTSMVDQALYALSSPRTLAVQLAGFRVGERVLAAVLAAVTGAVIVADILVASVERRGEGDESLAPAYARQWMEELGVSSRVLSGRLECWGSSHSCSRVHQVLLPLCSQ